MLLPPTMNARTFRAGLLASLFVAGCGGELETQPPPPVAPPPPPLAAPPSAPPAPPPEPVGAASTTSAVPPLPPTTAQAQPGGPLPPLPSQAPQYVPAPGTAEAPPPESQWVYASPGGRWVYTTEYGWIWVPDGAGTSEMEGVPYAYLYTPAHGWTWYVSPWGVGAFHYGVWVRHPWHPVGWRGGWVAHPRVYVRLGGPRHHRR